MASKVFRILKNHPKKIIFFGTLTGIGINYGKQKYEEKCMMRAYCKEALKYGEAPYHLGDEERHITVILNPAASNGKAFSKYEKYCAPLFHLAGMKVALVKTEYENQAKEIMNVMDNTQAVIVAGGDGTLSEVLTGLLRRDDAKVACKRFPLGILPLGESNSAASSVWGFNKIPDARHLAEAAMAVVKNVRREMDVLEITPIEEDADRKPIYAASEIEWGAFRDTRVRKSIYWYWAFLKKYMVYVFSSYKDLTWNCSASIEYSLPCSGCQRCKEKEEKDRLEALEKQPKRWWAAFVPRAKTNDVQKEKEVDYSKIVNEKCGETRSLSLENVCDVRISSSNSKNVYELDGFAMSLQIGKENMSTLDFIKEGWRRESGVEPSYDQEYIIGEILLRPSDDVLKDSKGKERELHIDSEKFEVKSMRIRSKPNQVSIFAPSAK